MKRETKKGCWISALIVGGIVAVIAALVLLVINLFVDGARKVKEGVEAARVEAEAEALREAEEWMREQEDGRLVIDQAKAPRLEAREVGEPLKLEEYLAWTGDERVTELARENFRESIRGAPVEWQLVVDEITAGPDGPGAELRRSWMIKNEAERRTRDGTLSLRANFDEASREALLPLRRGDEVTVAGRLVPDPSGRLVIEEARLAGED